MTSCEIFDVISGKSKKLILTKLSSEIYDDAKKRFKVDYNVWKRTDNIVQINIVNL